MQADKAKLILRELSAGSSLRAACRLAKIDPSSVLQWTEVHPDFAQRYAQARARGYALLADEIIEISDDSSGDVIETESGPKQNAEFVARSRLRVDSRKWMLAKMLPKVYGDRIEHDHKGGVTLAITSQDAKL